MSDDSDDDEQEPPVLRYHRISATNSNAVREVIPAEFPAGTDRMWHIQSLLTHDAPGPNGQWEAAPSSFYAEWCTDVMLWNTRNERSDYTCFMDENGLDNELTPNHRANAIVNAGRFVTLERNMIDDCKNQRLKDNNGSNYFCGDVVVEICEGSAPPDHNVYGTNPIASIDNNPTPSQIMIERYGSTLAELKISPTRAIDMSRMREIMRTRTLEWIVKPYRIAPYGMTDQLKLLLQSWNFNEEEIGVLSSIGL
jgi:hypothetical protein